MEKLLRTIALPALVCLFVLPLSSCGGSTGTSGSQGNTIVATPYVYGTGVVGGSAAVLSYAATSTGSTVTPNIAATMDSGDIVLTMRTDGAGNLYVMTTASSSYSKMKVYVYAMSSGALSLKRSFSYNSGYASGMTADKNGTVYISVQNGPVEVFAATAAGAVSPTATLNVGQSFNGMATDSSGNIYGLSPNALAVLEYSPGFASLTPTKTYVVDTHYGSSLEDLAVDKLGNVYALIIPASSAVSQVLQFSGGATTGTVYASSSSLNLGGITTDPNNQLWTVSQPLLGSATFAKLPSFTGFSSTQDMSGNYYESMVVY